MMSSTVKSIKIRESAAKFLLIKNSNYFYLKLSSNIRCLEMYHYMYKDAQDLYLTRKREKFENFIREKGSETIIDDLIDKNKEYLKLCYIED